MAVGSGSILRMVLVVLLLLAGCGRDWLVTSHINADWYRRSLEEGHLSHWLEVAPTASGFFNTTFTRRWQPLPDQPGDIEGQARIIYSMAAGYELTGREAYRDQMQRGTEFLLRHFRDMRFGGWLEAVAPDGKMRSGRKLLGGQAAALFALAHVYRVTGEERYLQAALVAWEEIQRRFGKVGRGLKTGMDREFRHVSEKRDPMSVMRLFEALLALWEVSGRPEFKRGAQGLGDFVQQRLLQASSEGGAYVVEIYDNRWRPLMPKSGSGIDIGHQFRWAYLFSVGAERGLGPAYGEAATRLLDFAMAYGYDQDDGGVFATPGGAEQRKDAWRQAEALRALMHLAAVRKQTELWAPVTRMTDFVRRELVDRDDGGWYPQPRHECERDGCDDRQPDAAAIVALHQEAIRLVQIAGGH